MLEKARHVRLEQEQEKLLKKSQAEHIGSLYYHYNL
jgi:hypothetical protein